MFVVNSYSDMVTAARLLAENEITLNDLYFPPVIVETLKIESETWDDAKYIDYRLGELIVSSQKDLNNAYQCIFNENEKAVCVDITDAPILKFTIEDGCINVKKIIDGKYIAEIINEYGKVDMKSKAILALIILGSLAIIKCDDIIRAIKDPPSILSEKESRLVQSVASENQRGTRAIINNIGNGTVIYNDEPAVTYEEIRNTLIEDPEPVSVQNVNICDTFSIEKYDFKKQLVNLSTPASKRFWASTEWLNPDERNKLSDLAVEGIQAKKAIPYKMHIKAKIDSQRVQEAIVVELNPDDESHGVKMAEALSVEPGPMVKDSPEWLRFQELD